MSDAALAGDALFVPPTFAFLKSADGRRVHLLANATIGRAENSIVRIADPRVSAAHACLRYTGPDEWVLRDLGSKNGTRVGDASIRPGKDIPLPDGASLRFGGSGDEWSFHGGQPVELVVRTIGQADAVNENIASDGIIALPSGESPRSFIFRRADAWVLEAPGGEAEVLRDGATFEVASTVYQARICDYQPTITSGDNRPLVAAAQLGLYVSRDEEHVRATVKGGIRTWDLPSRNHLYLLVVLARAREVDGARGLSEEEAGWCHVEIVQKEIAVTSPEVLNVHVFRIRKDFGRLGFADPGQVIERRRMSGQIRIGIRSEQIRIEKAR